MINHKQKKLQLLKLKLIKNIFLQTRYSRRRSVASGLKIPNLFRPGATDLHLTGLLQVDSIKIYFWRNRSGNCFRFLLNVFFVLKWQISPIYQKCLKKVDTFCNWHVSWNGFYTERNRSKQYIFYSTGGKQSTSRILFISVWIHCCFVHLYN